MFRCTESWDESTISWNNAPTTDSCPLDTISGINRSSDTSIGIDITSEATRWYREKTDNYGVVITVPVGTSTSEAKYIEFSPDDYIGFEYRYIMMDEYADNQQYETFNMGRAGSGAVNLFTGEFTFVHDDVSVPMGNIPLTLSHIYRSEYVDINESETYGKCWNISAAQTLVTAGVGYNTYTDAQNSKHYMNVYDVNNTNIYSDTSGLGLKYNETNKTIIDEKGNTLAFEESSVTDKYILKSYTNSRQATVIVGHTGDLVSKLTDCHGRTANLTYSNNKLTTVTDAKGRITTYTYTSNKLTQIIYPDGTYTQFGYNTEGLMTNILDRTGICYSIEYESNGNHRVTLINEFSNKYITNSSAESKITFNKRTRFIYSAFSTEVVDDIGKISTVYRFDQHGRVIGAYENVFCNAEMVPCDVTPVSISEYEHHIIPNASSTQASGKYVSLSANIRGSSTEYPNLLKNGFFVRYPEGESSPESWTLGSGFGSQDVVTNDSCFPYINSFKLWNSASSRRDKVLSQTVSFADAQPTKNTLIASAWVKAKNPVNNNAYVSSPNAKFELTCSVKNGYNEVTTRTAKCDCEYTDWQYVAVAVPLNTQTCYYQTATVSFDFSGNVGECLITNVRLFEAYGTTQKISYPGGSVSVFGSNVNVYRKINYSDGMNDTIVYYDNSCDAVQKTVYDSEEGGLFNEYVEYNTAHQPTKIKDFRGVITENKYDEIDTYGFVKKSQEIYSESNINNTILTNYSHTYDYTNDKYVYSVTDERDVTKKTVYEYDLLTGVLTKTTYSNGQEYTYTYDCENDDLTAITAMKGNMEHTDSFLYNCGMNTQIVHNEFTYNYSGDAVGRDTTFSTLGYSRRKLLTNNGTGKDLATTIGDNTVTVEMDSRGNPVNKYDSDGTIATAEYDNNGDIKKLVDYKQNIRYNYYYNDIGAIGSVDQRDSTDNSLINKKSYTYDSKHRLVSTTDSATGFTYLPVYEKDSNDKIYPDANVQGMTLSGKYTDKFSYAGIHRVSYHDLILDGKTTSLLTDNYSYLSGVGGTTNFVSSMRQKVNGSTKNNIRFTYDSLGNISEIIDSDGKLVKYTYDNVNQLIQEDNYRHNKRFVYDYYTGGALLEKREYSIDCDGNLTSDDYTSYSYSYDMSNHDQLANFNGQLCSGYVNGCPTVYRGKNAVWDKYQKLTSYNNCTFSYNASGIRYKKNNTTYLLDGDKILSETQSNGGKLTYFYGTSGIIGFNYVKGSLNLDYYFQKNLQGDVIAVYSSNGQLAASYEYDAWGNHLAIYDGEGNLVTDTTNMGYIANINPIRYRGYYYDVETGFYYLKSRYYDPEVGRFISQDNPDYLGASEGVAAYNLYAYCGNNPVMYVDYYGNAFETIFDIISLGASVVEVCINPADPWAWVGLVGDAVDLIPFMTGAGEAVRIYRAADAVGETLQIAKAVDLTDDVADTVRMLDRSSGVTKSTRELGQIIHKGYKSSEGFIKSNKEYTKIIGIRPDYIDFDNKIIYELKPMNIANVRAGVRQLRRYNRILGGGYTLRLELY